MEEKDLIELGFVQNKYAKSNFEFVFRESPNVLAILCCADLEDCYVIHRNKNNGNHAMIYLGTFDIDGVAKLKEALSNNLN